MNDVLDSLLVVGPPDDEGDRLRAALARLSKRALALLLTLDARMDGKPLVDRPPPDAFCDEWIAIANEAEKLRVALEDWRWGKCEDCGAQLRGATATPGGLDSHRCSACYGKKYYPKEKP